MKRIVFIVLSLFGKEQNEIGIVNIDEEMVEAIYIPADHDGPIIAIPADERVF